ncbi:MAG: hypothetical protein Q8O71_01995 [bacterium]|nr:hypothetical protein [bacterium]
MQNPLPNKPVASSVGPLVGIIIVVIIIVLGGMYFWGQRVDRSGIDPMLENDAMTQSLENQSSSDDLTAIEADIDNTDLENLDAELNQINSDLEASGL